MKKKFSEPFRLRRAVLVAHVDLYTISFQCSGEVHEISKRPSDLSVARHIPNTLQPVEEHIEAKPRGYRPHV